MMPLYYLIQGLWQVPAPGGVFGGRRAISAVSLDEESEYSSGGSNAHQQWDSPVKDIDLIAAEDILCEDDDDNDSVDVDYSRSTSCSSKHSEGNVKLLKYMPTLICTPSMSPELSDLRLCLLEFI